MKAMVAERPRHAVLGVKKSAMKAAGIDFRGEKVALSAEMKECLLQLSTMVPDVPRCNERGDIDGTTLMQSVIDYILDLELQLTAGHHVTSVLHRLASATTASSTTTPTPREPLAESSLDNVIRHPRSQLSSPAPSPSLSDCEIRPPSK